MNKIYSLFFTVLFLFQIGFSPMVKLESEAFTFCEENSFDLKYEDEVYDFVNLNINQETDVGIISVLYNGKVYEGTYGLGSASPLIIFENSKSLIGHGLNFETRCGEFSFSNATYEPEIVTEDMPRNSNWFIDLIMWILNEIRSWFT